VFQAEILRRASRPLALLPLSILAIVMGWRFRAAARPRLLGLPMLGIIPLVFYGTGRILHGVFGVLGLGLLLSLGYVPAIGIFIGGSLILFVVSLIALAAQRR
jgi:hypothetical protein